MKSATILLTILFMLVFAMNHLVRSGSAAHQEKEVGMPVQEGVMTEQQRKHSKLYKEYSMGQRRIPDELGSGQPGILIKVHSPLAFSDKIPSSFESILQKLACDADAVVIGVAKNKASQLTENRDFLFTDYEISIQEVLKDNPAQHAVTDGELTVTRPGGAIQLNGKTVEAIDASFQPLKVGKRYLLFLRFIPTTGTYKAVNSLSSYQLDDRKVSRLTEQILQLDKDIDDPTSFIASVRTAVAGGCTER